MCIYIYIYVNNYFDIYIRQTSYNPSIQAAQQRRAATGCFAAVGHESWPARAVAWHATRTSATAGGASQRRARGGPKETQIACAARIIACLMLQQLLAAGASVWHEAAWICTVTAYDQK